MGKICFIKKKLQFGIPHFSQNQTDRPTQSEQQTFADLSYLLRCGPQCRQRKTQVSSSPSFISRPISWFLVLDQFSGNRVLSHFGEKQEAVVVWITAESLPALKCPMQ